MLGSIRNREIAKVPVSQDCKMDAFSQDKQKLKRLYAKGGILLFRIERPNRLYKGAIILSAVEHCFQRRAVYVREYEYHRDAQS